MKKIIQTVNKYVPKWAAGMLVLAVICAIIHVFGVVFKGFADFFNRTVAAFFRLILAKITGIFPFSLTEIAIICLPLIIGAMVFFAVRAFKKSKEKGVRYLCGFLAVLTYFYSSFVLTFALGYRGTPLEEKLDFKRGEVTKEQLYEVTEIVLDEINALAERTEYGSDRFSVMPYGYSELNDKLSAVYKKGAEKYGFLQSMSSKVKPVLLSEPMTYTHISGVYTFFTGEANVNTNFPPYNLPYTMAHEMAHQRGIAPENEANFVAFLISIESDDDYIRYSAYLNMFEYLSNALYKADKDMYKELIGRLDERVVDEMIAYSDFFDKYRDNVAADVSGTVNNSYLQSQGQTQGTKTYGLVVDLTVAYYKNLNYKV